MDLVSLKNNIEQLGSNGIQVAKEVASLFNWVPIPQITQMNSLVYIYGAPTRAQRALVQGALGDIQFQIMIRQGQTLHFDVYYSPGLGANGPTLADAVLATCESDYSRLRDWFFPEGSSIWLHFTINIQPGHDGAMNRGMVLYIDAFDGTDADLVRYGVVAEATEIFEKVQNAGWDPIASNGEALSCLLADEIYPNKNPGMGPAWMDGGRPDWVNNTDKLAGAAGHTNFLAIGCGILFINWMQYYRGYTLNQIIQAGGATLAETFKNITGGGLDGFILFRDLLANHYPPGQPCGLTTDNPFPGTMIGTVTDASSLGKIIGAEVCSTGGRPEEMATTDSAGRYIMKMVPGPHQVTVIAVGFVDQRDYVNVTMGTTVKNFALAKAPPVVLGTIQGYVTDSAGKSIYRATVGVEEASTQTNSAGNYTLSNIPSGLKHVTASKAGYNSSTTPATVIGGQTKNLDFELEKKTPTPKPCTGPKMTSPK